MSKIKEIWEKEFLLRPDNEGITTQEMSDEEQKLWDRFLTGERKLDS